MITDLVNKLMSIPLGEGVTFAPTEYGSKALKEDFADTFKPASSEEIKNRSKPKSKKGDAVKWGTMLDDLILLMDPRWTRAGFWYSVIKEPSGEKVWVKYWPDSNIWFTELRSPIEEHPQLGESFEDIFQPATDEEIKNRVLKPKEKKGDKILRPGMPILLEDPQWDEKEVLWKSKAKLTHRVMSVYYGGGKFVGKFEWFTDPNTARKCRG